uniref:Uncharacterized protein n=1 Tax=Glossina pallidipes TaxID=7398 RepID=A0A1B0AIA2_GLOPL
MPLNGEHIFAAAAIRVLGSSGRPYVTIGYDQLDIIIGTISTLSCILFFLATPMSMSLSFCLFITAIPSTLPSTPGLAWTELSQCNLCDKTHGLYFTLIAVSSNI